MSVQEIKRKIRVQEWSGQVQQCKESGMTVSAWCEANRIKKNTYYSRQKAVAEAISTEIEVRQTHVLKTADNESVFAEYKLNPSISRAAITLHLDCGTLEIHNGADAEVISNTLIALKRIC